MKSNILKIFLILSSMFFQKGFALSSGDVNVKLISGYFWLDNSCTNGGPQGKVVSFRIKNTKGVLLQGVSINLGTLSFTAAGGASYTSGTPSFLCRTSTSVYVGNIAAGDSATAFFYVGYNCLTYPNNTNITTDYLTIPVTLKDNNSGTVACSFTKNIYVIRNANNNTIVVLATTPNLVGTMLTISVAYSISNVKPGNIIDMELSTASTFPAGYSIMGCRITATSIGTDFPVGMKNTHYSNSIVSNLPSGGTVTIEWTLKITAAITGITSSNLIPFVVSDAGSAQRWQANTTAFTGTSTPTNSISISKKVNHYQVLTNDTVVYTIVLKNSSALYDIAIDQLVDNLPRDYKFLYMETNTGVFPRLVTYSNCTTYPVYQDTNLLNFHGQLELSAGVFSWVVPKSDSIKLIYSCKVSAITGLKDTNFITACVGGSSVGTAFAIVNIYSPLPIKVLSFDADKTVEGVRLSWMAADDHHFSHFNVYRQSPEGEGFIKLGEVRNHVYDGQVEYAFFDEGASAVSGSIMYKLDQVDNGGFADSYFASVDMGGKNNEFKLIRIDGNNFGIVNMNQGIKSIHVMIHDAVGKELYNENIIKTESMFIVPYDFSAVSGKSLLLSLETSGGIETRKILIE